MKAIEILNYAPINATESGRVEELVKSIMRDGWVGCPILVCGESLVTGSHRLAALHAIYGIAMDVGSDEESSERAERILEMDVAEDVSDIIDEAVSRYEDENGYAPDIDYGNIGWMLEGSWVEDYKDEITEW